MVAVLLVAKKTVAAVLSQELIVPAFELLLNHLVLTSAQQTDLCFLALLWLVGNVLILGLILLLVNEVDLYK